MLEADQQANAARHDLMFVASTRAYLTLESDPEQSLRVAGASLRGAMSELDREQVNPIALTYSLRCAAVLATAEQLLRRPPSEMVTDALQRAESLGDAGSASDLGYRVVLLHALGRHAVANPLAAQLRASGYRPALYRTLLRLLGQGEASALPSRSEAEASG